MPQAKSKTTTKPDPILRAIGAHKAAAAALKAACDRCTNTERELKRAETIMNKAGDRDSISADLLVDVTPMTKEGLFAFIRYFAQETARDPHQFGEDRINKALANVHKAMSGLGVVQ